MNKLCLILLLFGAGCGASDSSGELVLVPELFTSSLGDTLSANVTGMYSVPSGTCVGDYDGGRMICTDLDLRAVRLLGKKGTGPGEMMSPQEGIWHEGLHYIFDYMEDAIVVFNDEGVFQREIRVPAEYDKFGEFDMNQQGNFIMSTAYKSAVGLILDRQTGEIVQYFGEADKVEGEMAPAAFHMAADGHLIAVFYTTPRIVVYNQQLELVSELTISNEVTSRVAEAIKVFGATKEDFPSYFSSVAMEKQSNLLYVLAMNYYPGEANDSPTDLLYEFQYQNGTITPLNQYRLQGPDGLVPFFHTFSVTAGKLFAYDTFNGLFYRYQLPH